MEPSCLYDGREQGTDELPPPVVSAARPERGKILPRESPTRGLGEEQVSWHKQLGILKLNFLALVRAITLLRRADRLLAVVFR